ncbi:MAG TPA: MFS transporter [Gemmatimonadales bacterium]|nr:MFS transporter [Gemmatimonadales bacterium]
MAPTSAGMRPFFIVWAGQLVSVTGTALTGFGLQVWVFLETGSVTRLALVSLFLALPAVLLSPVAGALVDRWDRRLAMLGADAAAGAATLVIAVLFFTDSLQLWHAYLLIGVGAAANAFQVPAWMAAVTVLVPARHLGRANGLVQLNEGLSLVAAPALAGALLATVGLGGVLLADVITFAVGVATLTLVRFPRPEATAETAGTGSIRGDVASGWSYLRRRVGLLYLLVIYAAVNFVFSMVFVLLIPLVLSFASEAAAGAVYTIGGIGVVVASLVVGARGVPQRKVAVVMAGIFADGMFLLLTGWRAALTPIAIGAILMFANGTVVNATSQVIWQTKVAPAIQGRVFALRRMLAQLISPLAILLAGPLADRIFEPAMAEDGPLAGSVGRVLGTGPGRGIGLMIVLSGLAISTLALIGWLHPRVRNLETELPDQTPADDAGPLA